MLLNKDTVLYTTLGALVVGMLYLLYSNYELQRALAPEPLGPGDPALLGVEIGNESAINAPHVEGEVKAISANSLTIQTEAGVITVDVPQGTPVIKIGRAKTEAEVNQELALYNAEIDALMKDPQKNKEALARAEVPSPSVETPISLSAIEVGGEVGAAVVEAEGAARTALRVYAF